MEPDKILIHFRFAPNGTIVEIGERPQGLTPQQWFDVLSLNAIDARQGFAGARGVFRLTRERIDALKAESEKSAA